MPLVANLATCFVAFDIAKIARTHTLQLRRGETLRLLQEQDMTIIERTVGLAAALGTSALAFALTLA
ncbi:hypothetical protein GCM10011494_32610 [Novosphingobium endophyticum]|uniref:Uncharacterized protein n=1 Tax=Novosphingobium endophyticum TaxID=1955250 RepID=A0A916TV11_9SPHN|nr:hypothetical protein GCM10011494_32610 [Novosphingobium endophyticum]